MDINKINKNILCLLVMILVFIISLSINSRVSAVTTLPSTWVDDYYLYNFKKVYPTNEFGTEEYEKTILEQAKNDKRVTDGYYFYFACRTANQDFNDTVFLVKKDFIDNDTLYLNYDHSISGNAQSGGGVVPGFFLNLKKGNYIDTSGTFSTNDIIVLSTNTKFSTGFLPTTIMPNYVDKTGWTGIPLQTRLDTDYTINLYIETNYTGNICWVAPDDTKYFLLLNSPYILNSNYSLSIASDVLKIRIGTYRDIKLKLYNNTQDKELFTVNLTDYEDYKERLDLLDPFSEIGYSIPFSGLPTFEYVDGNSYTWSLLYGEDFKYTYHTSCVAILNGTFGGGSSGGSSDEDEKQQELLDNQNKNTDKLLESNKETQNKLDEQTEVMKENNETNKNIFQRIGDILSYINPFSENFFGRKLVDLIIDGLKSLFVPEEGFFDNYFGEIRQWFSDRLGFLWTPFDFVIEVLNRILGINFSEPVIHIPEIKAPFVENQVLISEMDYNLNTLKDNETFNNIHNLYLTGVDFIIIVAMINLARKKIEEVFEN